MVLRQRGVLSRNLEGLNSPRLLPYAVEYGDKLDGLELKRRQYSVLNGWLRTMSLDRMTGSTMRHCGW